MRRQISALLPMPPTKVQAVDYLRLGDEVPWVHWLKDFPHSDSPETEQQAEL